LNHYFTDNKKKVEGKSLEERLGDLISSETLRLDRSLTAGEMARITVGLQTPINPDMDYVAAEEAFENMEAYYKVCEKFLCLLSLISICGLEASKSANIS
jgi:hypothetical protein